MNKSKDCQVAPAERADETLVTCTFSDDGVMNEVIPANIKNATLRRIL